MSRGYFCLSSHTVILSLLSCNIMCFQIFYPVTKSQIYETEREPCVNDCKIIFVSVQLSRQGFKHLSEFEVKNTSVGESLVLYMFACCKRYFGFS